MTFINHRVLTTFTVAATIALGAVNPAQAVFTLTGTAAELVARGINADFETPDVDAANDDTEETTTQNLGAGWSFNLISGVANNWGVADLDVDFYGNPAGVNLPAPFDGRQIGFFNQNNAMSTAEVVSGPIGLLQSGQTYTLNVAVGTRDHDATAMNQIAYRVGLRAADGTDLGTFATTTMIPNSNPTSITDLAYTLDMSTVPGYVGSSARIVIGAFNMGLNNLGAYEPNRNAQANFDNVRLAGTFDDIIVPPAPSATLTINRQSGELLLSNTGSSNLNIVGYSLTSTNGAFDQSAWTSVANTYDQNAAPTPGNGSVDSDDPWTILSAANSATNLSESELSTGGNGGTLSTTTPIDLGNAWLRTPYQDVAGNLLLADGSVVPITIAYDGLVIPAGDLNGDGDITGVDWNLFKAAHGTSLPGGLTKAQAYLQGDLTGNNVRDLNDFFLFRNQYDLFNGGSGALARMLAGVPEPGTGLMLSVFGGLTFFRLRRRTQRGAFSMQRFSRIFIIAFIAVNGCLLTTGSAMAQITGVAHWSFDTSTLTIDSGNITAVTETTGNHNATPGFGGTGGASGTQYISQVFPQATSSVTGQFGNAMRYAGNNFLLFPNLTELMAAAGGPSYSVSMWYKTETAGGAIGSAYATLGNWGNGPANTGPTRFTYGFGPHTTTQIRGQVRRNEPTSGGGGTNGDDIWAVSVTTTPAPNDGNWHMLTWTADTTPVTGGQLRTYFDGVLLATTTSTDPSFAMGDSSSAVGGMGLKADSGTFLPAGSTMDEVYVFTGVLSQQNITDLFNSNTPPVGAFPEPEVITLKVDPATGQAQLRNDSAGDVTFSAYRIFSSTGALNPSGWDAISTGTPVPGFPQGDGSGNGWESPGGGNNPNDYNGDGVVDNADFVAWAKNPAAFGGNPAGYNSWKSAFGSTGGGPGGDDNELVEWNLTGESTLAVGEFVNLGQAFDIGGDQNLTFQYTTDVGVRSTAVIYGSIGGGSGGSVPEPSSWLMLLAGCGLFSFVWRRRAVPAVAQATSCLVIATLAASSASATVTNDRIYRFGENGVPAQTQENGVAGQPVGSGAGNPAPGTTLDHIGPSGSFQTLLATSCPVGTCPASDGNLPVYQDLTTVGTGRTGLGILFDGTDDYLNGFSLGFPPISRATYRQKPIENGGAPPFGNGSGTLNYDGIYNRGVQFWAFPHSGATAEQHVLSDTTEHGVRITAGGNWMLRHGGTNVNSLVNVNFNQWSHVMVAMPVISQPHLAVLYVDGVALTAHQENYDVTTTVNAQALIIGANTDANGLLVGTTNHFRGVLDEVEMFIWGKGYDLATNTVTNFGTFNFATDNGYAASFLSGVAGDIDNNGSVGQSDVNAFVAGWLSEKRVNNIRVGDLTTFADGDVNFDGITNLTDAHLLLQVLPGSGGGGVDLSGFYAVTGIPEPSTFGLAGLAVAALLTARRLRSA